jgi:hypothetical protein
MTVLGDNTEMWKKLVTSEGVSIRAAYVNTNFKNLIPTIILTNDHPTFLFFGSDPAFVG